MRAATKKLIRASTPRNLRNWLRSPTRSAGWLWDEAKHVAGVRHAVTMRPGWELRCHPAAYRLAYYAQSSDPEQIAEFDGFISMCCPGMVFFDVGAHFGLFSLAALHYGGPRARAIAIDPSPTAARIIKIQSRLNQVSERLAIVQASAGEKRGRQYMVATGVIGAGYFLSPGDHSAGELTPTQTVKLDELVDEFKLMPTHLKIDVEGFEASVLRGGRQVLSRTDAPLLFLELHNQIIHKHGGDPAETLAVLKSLGYKVFAGDGTTINEDFVLSKALIRVTARKIERGQAS